MVKANIIRKVREWTARYLPAEIIATVTALVGAFAAHQLSGSLALAAIGGTVGENIGYYGYFVVRGMAQHYAGHRQHPPFNRILLTAVKTHRDLLVEFGPAEVLDSLFVRPFCMYIGPQLLHHFAVGILLGKLAADVVFYTFAIIGYEIKKYYIH